MRTTRLKLKWTLALVALAGGLSLGTGWRAEAAKKGHKAPADTADCKTDKDCVVVADDCCPCSQGGKQRAIPKKEKDAYEKDRKKRCADTACTEMISQDPTCSQHPSCLAGICELGD
jgi:hypothetical protein